jgi:hypothetical protein
MTTPLIGSAGHEAHHPSRATLRFAEEAIFQSAGTRRSNEDTGACPEGVCTVKPWMPCVEGSTPVAIEVQITGEALETGCSWAETPRSARSRRWGSWPRFQSSRITFHEAPSRATTTAGPGELDCIRPQLANRTRASRARHRSAADFTAATLSMVRAPSPA